jgi:hypothetical protein
MNNSNKIIYLFSIIGGLIAVSIHMFDSIGDYADTAPIENNSFTVTNPVFFYTRLLLFFFLGLLIGLILGKILTYLKNKK